MFTHSRRWLPLAWTLGALAFLAAPASPVQESPVVFSEARVSSDAASLRLEIRDQEDLEISFRDGVVRVNGSEVGSYARGDALEAAWRDLVGEAVRLEPAELARVLRDWAPPAELSGAEEGPAETIRATLGERLAGPAAPAAPAGATLLEGQEDDVLRALLLRTDRLRQLTEVLDDLRIEELTVRVGEDVVVGPDEVVNASLVVVDGDLEIAGAVEGHVVALGGTVELREGGRVAGDLQWRDGEVRGEVGIVEGSIVTVEDLRTRLESEIRDEIRRALPEAPRGPAQARSHRGWFDGFRPFRSVLGGIAGLIQTAVTYLVLLLIGAGVLSFFPRNLEVVAETARREPGRAALVGIAGFVLFFPVWILGIIGLAVSLIGIPLLLGWIPLFPVAVGAACLLGFLALAYLAGEWVAGQRFQGLDWVEETSALHRVALGLGLFLVAFAAANVIQMAGPWLGFLRGLLLFAGAVSVMAAVTTGFGAVLLSRAGRVRPYAVPRPDAPVPEPGGPGGGADPLDDEVREWEREFRGRRSGEEESGHGEARGAGPGTATLEEEGGEETPGPGAVPDAEEKRDD